MSDCADCGRAVVGELAACGHCGGPPRAPDTRGLLWTIRVAFAVAVALSGALLQALRPGRRPRGASPSSGDRT